MSIASNRLKLLAILALFILPLGLAALMFAGRIPMLTSETVNQGKLVQPPVPLDWNSARDTVGEPFAADGLLGSWVLLLPVSGSCDQSCMDKATGLRQVHKATGREQHRIRVVILEEADWGANTRQQLSGIYDQFVLLEDPQHEILQKLQQADQRTALDEGSLPSYLVDPLGNIMMAYDMADSETRLSKDLKRLLKWSKQDEG